MQKYTFALYVKKKKKKQTPRSVTTDQLAIRKKPSWPLVDAIAVVVFNKPACTSKHLCNLPLLIL